MNLVAVQRCEFTEKAAGAEREAFWSGLDAFGISLEAQDAEMAGIQLHRRGAIKNLIVLAVPSLQQQIVGTNGDGIDVHSALTEQAEADILFKGLKFPGYHMPPNPERPDPAGYLLDPKISKPDVLPVRYGGASLVMALTMAGWLARNGNHQTLIVGAEALSKLKSSDLVRAAGKSICPDKLVGTTLDSQVPITLITAYALLESNYLNDSAQLESARPTDGPCMSGNIHTGEIAGANDGAIALLVGKAREGSNNVYLASGSAVPEHPMSWIEVPSRHNMARSALNKLKLPPGLKLPETHVENYDCFFIAKLLQAAAILDIPLNNENLPQILQFCSNWDQVSSLKDWASWGISSAKKIHTLVQKMRAGDMETAAIIGNGGVGDAVSSAFLTTNAKLAGALCEEEDAFTMSNPYSQSPIYLSDAPYWQPLKLQSDPDKLDGAKGIIDMMAYQRPVIKKNGETVQQGSTFVRVILKDGHCVLTNLALNGKPDSSFEDLTAHANIGSEVTLKKCNDTIRAVI